VGPIPDAAVAVESLTEVGNVGEMVIISDRVRTTDAKVEPERALIDPDALPDALGWKLEDAGLCRDDVCVPVQDRSALFAGERLDLAAVAGALGRSIVLDAAAGIAAVALPSEQRRLALDLHAPPFTLPDLDGIEHGLDEWSGVKKLLLAFASW
jgi:hypothetical protein